MAYAMSSKCQLARQQRQGGAAGITVGNVHRLNTVQEPMNDSSAGPIEDIRESVNVLQRSFEQLNGQLTRLRDACHEHAGLAADRDIQKLLGAVDLPELEQHIPRMLSRLHSALTGNGSEETRSEEYSNKPMP